METKQKKFKPITLVPYMGGKFNLINELFDTFNNFEFNEFIDVFGGGGQVFYNLIRYSNKFNKKLNRIIFNDLNISLYNMFVGIYEKDLKTLLFDQELGILNESLVLGNNYSDKWFNQLLKHNLTVSGVGKSIQIMYFFERQNMNSSGIKGGIDKCLKQYLNGIDKKLVEVKNSIEQFNGTIELNNLDFEELIDKYNDTQTDKTLWYLDPPYISNNKQSGYYNFKFGIDEHLRLLNKIKTINKGIIIISNYDNDLYNKYLTEEGWYKKVLKTKRVSSGVRPGMDTIFNNEYIWINRKLF